MRTCRELRRVLFGSRCLPKGVWRINDNGDFPPRWKIEGKESNIMKKPRGVALDPKHKEVIVSDMRLNAVLTFYFPESRRSKPHSGARSEEHTSELQSRPHLVCRLLLDKKDIC